MMPKKSVLTELIQRTVALFPEADVEIVETHHNRKADAPSGTALTLARAVQAVRPAAKILTGRSGASKRKPEDVTISAVRRGNIVGTHEVLISTDTQTITLKHEAHDRALFAEGAIAAAEILARRGPGYLTMQDIFNEIYKRLIFERFNKMYPINIFEYLPCCRPHTQ